MLDCTGLDLPARFIRHTLFELNDASVPGASLPSRLVVPVPPALVDVRSGVGPLRRSDIPLSAVDYHVSDILQHLMDLPHVQQLASGDGGGLSDDVMEMVAGEGLDKAIASAMWLHRSGLNRRVWLHELQLGLTPQQQQQSAAAAAQQSRATQQQLEHVKVRGVWDRTHKLTADC